MYDYSGLINGINKISAELDTYEGLVDIDHFQPFKSSANELEESIKNITEEGRNLRIGIIGAVKAGKSSFINALTFDGEHVLPKADTPLTAALTKIVYSPEPKATVYYYTKKDWQGIQKLSDAYMSEIERRTELRFAEELEYQRDKKSRLAKNAGLDFPEEHLARLRDSIRKEVEAELAESDMASCRELTQMATQRRSEINRYLDTHEIIDFKDLNDYVGANGRCAPIVKYVEIAHNSLELEGLEVVDTPGLDDPVCSRTIQTQKFIEKCDVIFLLSRCVPFLTSEDIGLLDKNLPNGNVCDAYLIASKLDSAMIDLKKKWTSSTFDDIAGEVMDELQQRAGRELGRIKVYNSSIMDAVYKMRDGEVYFVSSPMYGISRKIEEGLPLDDFEQHTIDQLKELNGFNYSDNEFLRDFSGIDNIRDEVLAKVRRNKDRIIQSRVDGLFGSLQGKFVKYLEDIQISAKNGRRNLENAKEGRLDDKLKGYTKALDSIRGKVRHCFDMAITDSKKKIRDMEMYIEEVAHSNRDIEVKTETAESSSTTGILWWRKTHYTTTTNHYASVHDVMRNLGDLAIRSKRYVYDELRFFFDTKGMQNQLKNIILTAFDTTSFDFDENDVIDPVNLVLAQLTIPEISVNTEQFEDIIARNFSGESVMNSDISRLAMLQDKAIRGIIEAFCAELELFAKKVEATLTVKSGTFVDDIENKLKGDIARLKAQLEDRERSLAEYDKFFAYIAKAKKAIRTLSAH